MRSISIAKGSQLLPPAFASIFDDLASSSLDIFFDPSQGLMNLPGFKWGMFLYGLFTQVFLSCMGLPWN